MWFIVLYGFFIGFVEVFVLLCRLVKNSTKTRVSTKAQGRNLLFKGIQYHYTLRFLKGISC